MNMIIILILTLILMIKMSMAMTLTMFSALKRLMIIIMHNWDYDDHWDINEDLQYSIPIYLIFHSYLMKSREAIYQHKSYHF